jgi:hypothetical protein|tara:strand:- start:321 stop:776 length:456 start_codon:yes stop_codon:yes gene_type:complete
VELLEGIGSHRFLLGAEMLFWQDVHQLTLSLWVFRILRTFVLVFLAFQIVGLIHGEDDLLDRKGALFIERGILGNLKLHASLHDVVLLHVNVFFILDEGILELHSVVCICRFFGKFYFGFFIFIPIIIAKITYFQAFEIILVIVRSDMKLF